MSVALFPHVSYGTRTTIHRSSSGFRSAIFAMFGIFPWRGYFAPVYLFVTGNANSNSVINVYYQFGIIRNWLYMMSVNISSITAFLASVIIPPINRFSPFGKVALHLCLYAIQRISTFPNGRRFSSSPCNQTFIRAKRSTMIGSIKLITTRPTDFIKWIATFRPAILRTIMGAIRSIGLDPKDSPAYGARFSNLGVFHNSIIPHNTTISPAYVAVALQRWADLTGLTPELTEFTP